MTSLSTVPLPTEGDRSPGRFVLADGTRVHHSPILAGATRHWISAIERASGVRLAVSPEAESDEPSVVFEHDPELPTDSYRVRVDGTGVRAQAGGPAGLVAAGELLRQEAGPDAFRQAVDAVIPLELPHLTATTGPTVRWRGILLDVARHFLPKSHLFRVIDLLSMHGINILQLHLTDDQGWRVPIEELPLLTERGAWRSESNVGTWRAGRFDGRPHGGFYTREDLREIVAYARARAITVVPEIDVPGHSAAAIAAYPQLGMPGSPAQVRTSWGISDDVMRPDPSTLDSLGLVLAEIVEIFDSPYIGIGGDEVPTVRWELDAQTRHQAATLGLAQVGDLHHWFLARLAEEIVRLGRRPLLWDDGWRADASGPLRLPPQSVVTVWHEHELAEQILAEGYDVVLAPETELYLDHRQSADDDEPIPIGYVRSTDDVHRSGQALRSRIETARPAAHGAVLGAQAQVWTEHLDDARRIDFALLPRLAAFAEIVGPRGPGTTEEFMRRLTTHHLPRLEAFGVEFRPLSGPLPWQRRPGVAGWPLPR